MSSWLEKLVPSLKRSEERQSSIPEGLWAKCQSCGAVLYRPELEKNLNVCPKCEHHMNSIHNSWIHSLLTSSHIVIRFLQ